MAEQDPIARGYVEFFLQRGGQMPIYRGVRYYQGGEGFGDFLRGLLRHVIPVAIRGAAKFFGETAKAQSKGVSIGEAALSALKPAAQEVLSGASEAFQGHGRKRKRTHKQRGGAKRRRVYKAVQRRRKQPHRHAKRRIVSYNF